MINNIWSVVFCTNNILYIYVYCYRILRNYSEINFNNSKTKAKNKNVTTNASLSNDTRYCQVSHFPPLLTGGFVDVVKYISS
jgi:uncharacterized ion transporter superfamily protein YfcC